MGEQPSKTQQHEDAAHEKRNWVRLTYDCNDRCVFCLDAHTHDGTNRDREEIRAQILDGRRKGAQRLILSGGEPTIHPDFIAFVKLGRLAGYRKVQTVTNGRMFAYPEFLSRSLDAGLSEITFSIHGPNARIHDALVGTKGAFEQEVRGLRNALDDGRPIINIDVCVNKGNVKVLPDILAKFVSMGVKEYDLLHVIPFGRAYTEGKETLFYDLEAMRPYLLEAFAYSKRPDVHVWLNRFPVQHLEGFESLIQDPYKLNDEVRGRKEEYAQLLERGIPLDCREPDRCRHCYMEPLCDRLDEVRSLVQSQTFSRVRIEPGFEAMLPPVYGGDPATRKRVEALDQVVQEAAAGNVTARRRLPVLGGGTNVEYPSIREHVRADGVKRVWVVARDVAEAEAAVRDLDLRGRGLELELTDYEELGPQLANVPIDRIVVRDPQQAGAALERPGGYEVAVVLGQRTAPWLLSLAEAPARLRLIMPTHDKRSTAESDDVVLSTFFEEFSLDVPVEGVPRCIVGDRFREEEPTLDTSMMTADGHLEIFRYTRRYVKKEYCVKSLRCKSCVHCENCRGLHVNYVRAHGFSELRPMS